jgi:DNA-binding NarL/FixJ family response regulator
MDDEALLILLSGMIGEGSVMNILDVENHPHFARIVVRQFLAAHAVTIVPSLAAAHAALAAADFAVVLVDFDLDDGKGAELVCALANAEQRPFVVAVSAHETGNQALVEAGADAVCSKSEFQRIAGVIEGLCGSRGGPGRAIDPDRRLALQCQVICRLGGTR